MVRRLSRIHRRLYLLTRGRVGRRLVSNDMLLLTTKGRKSGRKHTVPLLYLTDGDRQVVIASYGGRPAHPSWYLNLVRDPKVEVQISGRRFTAHAQPASPTEREQWWPRITSAYPGYASYQSRTPRKIPVVFLKTRGTE